MARFDRQTDTLKTIPAVTTAAGTKPCVYCLQTGEEYEDVGQHRY